MEQDTLTVGIVGTGAVATALVRALARPSAACHVRVWGRDADRAREVAASAATAEAVREPRGLRSCDAVLIAVSDSAIDSVAASVAAHLTNTTCLFHTSGASFGYEAMKGRATANLTLGSVHPLVAVARDAGADVFEGMPFVVESEGPAGAELARGLVERLGGVPVLLPVSDDAMLKARYHALATMVATGVVALVDSAARTMVRSGGDADAFRRAYAKLAASAAANVERGDGADVLTGAVARGDKRLIEEHRRAIMDCEAAGPYEAMLALALKMMARKEP